ncbi:methyltransferase domain-containing protein [Cellulomonas composti]|uniref:RNA methyltransferase n=1 Tax=Cellulomonas composti TaxID=266130 RepID=A0A511JEN1_9CELL|nr:methyltransferase domain-containing protein [Cellulomonas composti]GEL96425.1 RNA methyltransferase [Cellulomonas composti]
MARERRDPRPTGTSRTGTSRTGTPRTGAPRGGTSRAGGPSRQQPSSGRNQPRPTTPPAPTTRIELTFLPGLGDVLRDEVARVLSPARPATPVPGRDDALVVTLTGPVGTVLADVRRLRTAVAAFVWLHFDVPRPRSLVSGDHLARIVDAVYASLRAAGSSSFRFEAAGADSAVFARLADELRRATGLAYDPEHGELVVKVRRGTARGVEQRANQGAAREVDPGWDVLVRIGPRPLSARTWRVADFPGAANATIAAAMVALAGPRDDERVLNLMCGSGTLLVERLLAAGAAQAVGVDVAPDALDAAARNVEAAGLSRRVTLLTADALAPDSWLPAAGGAGFDLVLADPPWGALHGSHDDAERVHTGLLRAAHDVTAPGARLVVLTHEVKVMERCVRAADALWRAPQPPVRVYAKGHHPRIWLLHHL